MGWMCHVTWAEMTMCNPMWVFQVDMFVVLLFCFFFWAICIVTPKKHEAVIHSCRFKGSHFVKTSRWRCINPSRGYQMLLAMDKRTTTSHLVSFFGSTAVPIKESDGSGGLVLSCWRSLFLFFLCHQHKCGLNPPNPKDLQRLMICIKCQM